MESESRANMVRSAAALISERGASGTSFSDVLADSGAPRGSIYHHFPEGKRQLTLEAMDLTAGRVVAYLRSGTGTTPREVLDHFVAIWRLVVVASNGTKGCAIAGVAVDADESAASLIAAARDIFRSWSTLLAEQLRNVGVPAPRARSVAVTALAAMEGALILCRTESDVAPLDLVADELRTLVR